MTMIDELEKIRTGCKRCHGSGFKLVRKGQDGYIEDCVCIKTIADRLTLIKANIPPQYWDFGMENIGVRFRSNNITKLARVDTYIKRLRFNIEKGKGFWFCAPPGLGKSTVICSILKYAIKQDYEAYFARASHMVTWKFDALRNKQTAAFIDYVIRHVDILAIEEIEKVYLASDTSMNNQIFYEFISDIYDSKKAILISSNQDRKDVLPNFPTFIADRLIGLPVIRFFGKSERPREK